MNGISLSTTKAEYIPAGSCYIQVLQMKQMLSDYGIIQKQLLMFYDNISSMNITKNHVQHRKTKHIDISHHII